MKLIYHQLVKNQSKSEEILDKVHQEYNEMKSMCIEIKNTTQIILEELLKNGYNSQGPLIYPGKSESMLPLVEMNPLNSAKFHSNTLVPLGSQNGEVMLGQGNPNINP